ncbi:glutaredoxin domain-containing protein [Ditylenchus destructor]|uniref:Glutaredoxin domain-containing protein n=1 Tax=Ditylenchus destructor TaxID=166010 RepID=A0AAD4R521_9BILA|nr:glutaredoxin domain-containing protein [Ditylenchus destructor]
MWNRSILALSSGVDLARRFTCTAAAGGVGSGLLLGSVLLVHESKEETTKKPWTVEYPSATKSHNEFDFSRRIVSDFDKTGLNLKFYQYQSCPFCCKLRAFLDYYGFSYDVIEVNPVTKSQIKFSPDYKKVPILHSSCCEKPLVQSSLIISMLKTYLLRKDATLPSVLELYPPHTTVDPKSKKPLVTYPNQFVIMPEGKIGTHEELQNIREEREIREWVDDWFIHLISPNVYRTWSESLETFRHFDKVGDWERNFSTVGRYMAIYIGAAFMWQISKILKKRHKIDDERKALSDAIEFFLSTKGPDRKFAGGNNPNLADLSLYGALNSFAGCTAYNQLRVNNAFCEWFDAVDTAVKEKRGRKLLEEKCKNLK